MIGMAILFCPKSAIRLPWLEESIFHLTNAVQMSKWLGVCLWCRFGHFRSPKNIPKSQSFIRCSRCYRASIWALNQRTRRIKTQNQKKNSQLGNNSLQRNKKIFQITLNCTWAMKRTLDVWPVSSATFTIEGYFQSVSWFCVKPWELRSSLSFLFHSRAQTCEPVSIEFKQAPVWVFQNLMHLSLPPPPEASKFPWNGHQARALTAAVWSSSLWSHCVGELEEAVDLSHMWRRLSFPPLANCWPEADHFNPQTSWWCPL